MKICVALYCFSLFARLFARVESKINFTRLVTHCQTQIQQQKTRSDSVYCTEQYTRTVCTHNREEKNCLARLCYNSYLCTSIIRVAIDVRQMCQNYEMSQIILG